MKFSTRPRVFFIFIVISFLFSLHPATLAGQKQEVDAVYLLNGEVFRGSLLVQPNTELISLQTLCHNTRVFPSNEIVRIEREIINLNSNISRTRKPSGYFNRTDLGALIGSGGNENNSILSLQMVNGYKFGKRYYPGVGFGIEFYEYAVIPVFADFTYSIFDQGVTPFLRAGIGYSIPLEDPVEQWGTSTQNQGGILYYGGIGTAIPTGQSSSLVISLMYRFQSLKSVYTEDWNEDVLNLEKQYNRIALRIGFLFD